MKKIGLPFPVVLKKGSYADFLGMTWSLKDISYRMAGRGSWKRLLPDKTTQGLYGEIYPDGRPLFSLQDPWSFDLLSSWQEASIVRIEGDRLIPLGPIMTDADLEILRPWFKETASAMVRAVCQQEKEYRALAQELAGEGETPSKKADNILTILVCALTLDSSVFSRLRQEVIGTYPPRGRAGHFFFWGYAFAQGPQRIFGFTTYSGLRGRRLHMIRSHGLNRRAVKAALERWETWECLNALLEEAFRSADAGPGQETAGHCREKDLELLKAVRMVAPDHPTRLLVPVFSIEEQEKIFSLCHQVSQRIMDGLHKGLGDFEALWPRCSFARCCRSDVLCLVFHLAYSYAADRLVEEGVIPDFPKEAGGEWGMWMA